MPEYWMHYIGRGLYSPEDFEKEAKKLGVQRAIPFAQLKNFKWGDTVLLAQHHKEVKGEEVKGKAKVFGYFIVTGVSNTFPEEMKQRLVSKLRVKSCFSSEGIRYERRRCGGYYVGVTYIVEDDLKELVEKTKETCMEFGVDPNFFKYFLNGEFRSFDTPLEFSPARFTRGYMRIMTDEEIEGVEKDEGELRFIYSYEQRKYLTKKELEKMKNGSIDAYVEQT